VYLAREVMTAQQKHHFYTELAKLLEAGFNIRQAADAMLETGLPRVQAGWLRSMSQGLDAGRTITVAFGAGGSGISDLERSMLGAGERGGCLAAAYQHLADYFGMLAALRVETVRRLLYPIFVLHLGIFVAVVPKALMSGAAEFGEIAGHLLLALIGVYAAGFSVVVLVRGLLKSAPQHAGVDRLLNRIPLVKRVRGTLAMARFTRVYHMGILAGLSMVETTETAAKAAHSGVLLEAGRALALAASEGNQLGPVMLAIPAFPKAFARSYATAEQSGTLDKDLERWAEVYQTDAARAAGTLATAMTTLLYVTILLFVAWGIWSFYSGYFGILERMGEE
jgi:type II secretory pathway component PulF